MNSKLPLNEPQERRLTIVLARLEGALRHLRADMLHRRKARPLRVTTTGLTRH